MKNLSCIFSRRDIIFSSTLLRDMYFKRGPRIFGTADLQVPLGTPLKIYLEELAMEQHRLALVNGHAEVHQWSGHSVRSFSWLLDVCLSVPLDICFTCHSAQLHVFDCKLAI